MALVPFRVSGAAASQQLSEQLLQIGPYSLRLHQRPNDSGNTSHLHCAACNQQSPGAAEAADHQQHRHQQPNLSHVGLVLWQSGYVLSDFLLLRLPQLQARRGSCSSSWAGVRVLELGCGAGTVGMFLASAGAQVVITDQQHILPLTLENLELNFPQTTRLQGRAVPPDKPPGPRDTEQKQQLATLEVQHVGLQQPLRATKPGAPSLSVNAALAAAFCGATAVVQAAGTATDRLQQQLQEAFSSGPLAVEYTWGETAQVLQQRVAAAAAARLNSSGCVDNVAVTVSSARTSEEAASSSSSSSHAVQQQQHGGSEVADLLHPACYDVVVGADLLYDPSSHAALLGSLQELCAAHTQVFMCYRQRGLQEQAFEACAAASGWTVENVPPHLLHPEFQGGDYRLMRMTKTC